uniref:E3 ubiquitin-protein ligase n=1 Tax=Strigamia maritima TaxID=126957 RepID=T1JGA7_STRMM
MANISIADINAENAVKKLLEKFESSQLTKTELRNYWRDVVPLIYSPALRADCLNLVYDEDQARIYLFNTLEQFICNGKPEDVFKQLKALDDPPALCGRVFKTGEPTYSCRDCGMDPTCVLCVDCFKTSEHRNHRYKMSTSGGGGYCDCGDVEAWKTAAFCANHSRMMSPDGGNSPLDRMPADLVARAQFVLNTVLVYCHQMLTWERGVVLAPDLVDNSAQVVDSYTTMLFNDEVHTYEQVINTLHRAIDCPQKEAIDFATMIDREGRSIVRCDRLKQCEEARLSIEKSTTRHGGKALKVLVMHTNVVAHQLFAMRLLTWLQGLIKVSDGLRNLFNSAMLAPSSEVENSILEGVLFADTQLWKSARTQWHQLIIGGMLMDQECKKTFAQLFSRNYPTLMKEFITDDHEHSLSITSLSVQIFTVPTLAHKLVMEDNVLTTLLMTFLQECDQRLNQERKLAFDRSHTNVPFKRAQYILFDLKYILNSRPDNWNNSLRKHFLEGLSKLLTIMNYMQGMDSATRQVGQHMEFEPEWESAFQLHLRLAPVITLVVEWCGSDRVVLIKTYRAALKSLQASHGTMRVIGRELANHSATCIDYDVATQPDSIHLPLSRFVAALHLMLDNYNLSYDSVEFNFTNKPTPEQLLEMPLRTQVMIAQVHAGMWRRNGYSLLNQIFFYHTPKCRSEMLDRDVVMLQTTASLIESNEFLLHLLNKFGLVSWARAEYESDYLKNEDDSIRQAVSLAEEFLRLLITIVSERYLIGVGQVTEEDCIKKEVAQQLCIEPMAHSQLAKTLAENPNHETGMETVINEVASFKKPKGNSKGMYEIKPEWLKVYNPFFYHYTREEQSKAEEAQCKRKKLAGEEECCPPPVPPKFAQSFAMTVNVLQCDIMLHLMSAVLERAANIRSRSFSESQFQKILYLIGCALHEEELYYRDNDPFFSFTGKAFKKGLMVQLEGLVGNARIEAHKDLLNWVVRKMKQVHRLRNEEPNEAMETGDAGGEEDQRSAEAAQEEKRRRAEMAAARRSRIMAQMSTMQKNFIREHAELYEKTKTSEGTSFGSSMDLSESCSGGDDSLQVCLGPKQSTRVVGVQRQTCILCQEDEEIAVNKRTMVLAAFIQKSTVLSKTRGRLLDKPDEFDPIMMPADLFSAPHTSTCSHVMHAVCWQQYVESVLAKERRRPVRFRLHLSFDVDKNEFLCPLCECLSNSIMPLVPQFNPTSSSQATILFDDWLKGLEFATELLTRDSGDIGDGRHKSEEVSSVCRLEEVASYLGEGVGDCFSEVVMKKSLTDVPSLDEILVEMLKIYTQATYTIGLGVNQHPQNKRVPLMTWWSCAYTIHSIEELLRDQGKPLFGELSTRQSDCLAALVRLASFCTTIVDAEMLREHALRLMNAIFDNNWPTGLSLLQVDVLELMVSLMFLLPHLFVRDNKDDLFIPTGGVSEHHVMRLAYSMHLVQLFMSTSLPDPSSAMDTSHATLPACSADENALFEMFMFVRRHSFRSSEGNRPLPTSYQLLQFVQQTSTPFLRCCALFFHYLTGVPSPAALRDPTTAEFEPLKQYLDLPSFDEIWQNERLKALIQKWISCSPTTSNLVSYPLSVNHLVRLPRDYSELINTVSLFTCPNSDGDDSRTPTMCLVCGEMLCSQSYCCQTELDGQLVGACTYHAHFCGAGVGAFLRVRECKVLLLAGKNKGCFISPPYLDDYGETDQGLRRGNPLHLCSVRYKKLHHLWLGHGVAEEIAHALESNSNILSTDWYHL